MHPLSLLRLIVMTILGVPFSLFLTQFSLAQNEPMVRIPEEATWTPSGVVVSELPPLIARPEFPGSEFQETTEPLGSLGETELFEISGLEEFNFQGIDEAYFFTSETPLLHVK